MRNEFSPIFPPSPPLFFFFAYIFLIEDNCHHFYFSQVSLFPYLSMAYILIRFSFQFNFSSPQQVFLQVVFLLLFILDFDPPPPLD